MLAAAFDFYADIAVVPGVDAVVGAYVISAQLASPPYTTLLYSQKAFFQIIYWRK